VGCRVLKLESEGFRGLKKGMKSEENLSYSCIIYLARNSSKEISLDDYKIYEIMNALVLCKNWVFEMLFL
jgi:hypothetical protein